MSSTRLRSWSPARSREPRTKTRGYTPRWRSSGSWPGPSTCRPRSCSSGSVVAVRLEQLSFGDLEELREQITEYYETYYAELRDRLTDHSLGLSARVPGHLKGYRRIVTELGEDGAVIRNWPGGGGDLCL